MNISAPLSPHHCAADARTVSAPMLVVTGDTSAGGRVLVLGRESDRHRDVGSEGPHREAIRGDRRR